MIINKNQFFATLAKNGDIMKFASTMLDESKIPAPVRYQFDSTYEWDTELESVKEMLTLFVSMGIVSKQSADEIMSAPAHDNREKVYDMTTIAGIWPEWIEKNIYPAGSSFVIDAEKNVVTTTGVLPVKEIAQ